MMQRLLRPNRNEAPRKKLRGLRRYFRRVFARAESETLELQEDHWFDFMHYHPDWYGYGNLSWRMRARHLQAMATVFRRYARELSQFEKPYQLWIYLNARDAGQDAVYVHSPNPQHDDFPMVSDDMEWGITAVSQYFEGLLPGFRLRAGAWGNSECYHVYASGVGVPLERSLHQAASTGDIQAAARMLGQGAAIDGLDANGLTPLHAAAARGQVAMIDWLLDHGAAKNPYAASAGLPLHLAAREGHDEAVRLLLYRGADIRNPDPRGQSAQDLARERGHAALAGYLDEFLRNDVPPEWMHQVSLSAAAAGEYFRRHPDELNTVRYHGHTPLGWAAHLGDPERVGALLDLGARLSPEAAIVMGQIEFVQEWLAKDPLQVNALSIEGRDLPRLYFAAVTGNVAIARLLLEHGADVNSGHKSGSTVLYHAVEFGRAEMVRFLIEHGADVNRASRYGLTPLHEAARKGDLAIARMLVAAGADPAARTRDDETVLDAALTGGNAELVQWLTQLVADGK